MLLNGISFLSRVHGPVYCKFTKEFNLVMESKFTMLVYNLKNQECKIYECILPEKTASCG